MGRVKAVGVALLLLAFALAAAPVLVACARSRRGRAEGLFGVALGACGLCAVGWLAAPAFGYARPDAAGLLALAAVPLVAWRFAAVRRTAAPAAGPVGSHVRTAGTSFVSPDASGVEDEYAWAAVLLVTRLDPFMPRAEARATRAKIDDLLSAVADLPEYRGLARVAAGTPWRLLRGPLDPGHCFSYRPPPGAPGERFGLLVFLHGHGSNFPFFVHALRPLCDRLRLCLVAPTFGYGNWEAPGGTEAIESATRFGLAEFGADPARVFLGGISQGGAGVGRAGAAHPELFAGLIFISPTMEPAVIRSAAFLDGWRGRSVLVIQGGRDRNVHPRTVDAAVGWMEAVGVRVTQHRDPDAGHFLFFAQLDAVTERIGEWITASLRPGRV
jgi:pimeloyl-ACP methyl ester carboxylesterase